MCSYEIDDGIAILTLNNPERRNALSRDVLDSLKTHLGEAARDREVRAVIIRATGPAFSAGHDLRELVGGTEDDYRSLITLCTEVMEAIRMLPKPVIAQVHAVATAAGCQLAATCDLVVASENATFATPGVKIGLFCTTPGVALSRAVGPKKAMEMLLTGIPISAREAQAQCPGSRCCGRLRASPGRTQRSPASVTLPHRPPWAARQDRGSP